ncbi:gamma-glutamyltranspeptidase 1 [Elysia marginata]|uniref:Gamma-glutamyltranspeptidase 1 n=1 Tax=Elysia marginata TaxID=1093978 RepID=A0AAV4K233_9GAST|nr:gamma-glutamyltranspeptidase 1 [Elysia marginata]
MESIEQPFDSLARLREGETNDKLELIDSAGAQKYTANGSSPEAENSPLHQSKTTNSILHGPQNHGLRVIIISSIVFALAVTVALILTIFLEPKQIHGHAAVSSQDSRCSQLGLNILKQGGNAVDGAIATAFCYSVINPGHGGLGGGGFALVHDHKFKKSWGYNFREQAPAASVPDMITASNANKSMVSVGVPGFVKGLHVMHSEHGVLPWKDLVHPSIDLAEYGVMVAQELSELLERYADRKLFDQEPLRSIFQTRDGSFKSVNNTYRIPQLARTLERVRDDPESFYTGSLADEFVAEVKAAGGIITLQDMKDYKVEAMDVVEAKLKEMTMIGLPPPAGGVQVGLMLNMIDKLGWKKDQEKDGLLYHQLIETYKFGYGHRSLLGDPATNPGMAATVAALLKPEFADGLVALIDNNRTFADPAYYGGGVPVPDKGTAQISVIDSAEVMVSLSMSLNDPFGNQVMLPSLGIMLNNELMDFDQNASSPNGLLPGKRPLSSIAPTVLINEEHPCNHRLILGGVGGIRITTALVETIVNSVVFKKNISSAVDAPRLHNQLDPYTLYEAGFNKKIRSVLEAKGHQLKLEPLTPFSPKVMAVEKTNDDVKAFADYRTRGGPAAQF